MEYLLDNTSELYTANDYSAVCPSNSYFSNMQLAVTNLTTNYPFAHFDLNLLDEDTQILSDLHISKDLEYENFAEFNTLFDELKNFIEEISPNNNKISNSLTGLITRLVSSIIQESTQGDFAHVFVRSHTINAESHLLDHHVDKCPKQAFNESLQTCDGEYSVVFTLKGLSTWFYNMPVEMREKFNLIQSNKTHCMLKPNAEILADMLYGVNAASSYVGQGSVFLLGAFEGAVHTPPPVVYEPRLFIGVFPNTLDMIMQIKSIKMSKK